MQPKVLGLRSLVVAMVAFGLLNACAVSTALEGRPGVDTTTIDKGMPRERVEELLGPPEQEWVSVQGVTYCLYEFDGGVPSSPGAALGILILDIGTVGVFEGALYGDASPDELLGAERETRIISFDADEKVLGIFNWADHLPPDGIPRMNDQPDPELELY